MKNYALLTNRKIEAATTKKALERINDGNGLYLVVRQSGIKSWEFRYTKPITKKIGVAGLGGYPVLSLKAAREKANQYRLMIKSGIDPTIQKKKEKLETLRKLDSTLKAVTLAWLKTKEGKNNDKTNQSILRKLELHIFPKLSDVQIQDISAPMVIKVLRKLENENKTNLVRRICQILNQVMDYSVNTGLIEANSITGIKHAFKQAQTKSHVALNPSDLAALVDKLDALDNKKSTQQAKLLLLFQLHTMTRPNEAASARWDEFDFETKTWTIPASRMKNKRNHVIPLTDAVIEILETMKQWNSREFDHVFTHKLNKTIAIRTDTVNQLLYKIGYKNVTTAHGLRSLASTALNEQGFDSELIEVCLSHIDKNAVRRTYNRTNYIERRRIMMNWWSDFILNNNEVDGKANLKAV